VLRCKEALNKIWFNTFDGKFFYLEGERIEEFPLPDSHTAQNWVAANDSTMLLVTRKKGEGCNVYHIKGDELNIRKLNNEKLEGICLFSISKFKDECFFIFNEKIMKYLPEADSLIVSLNLSAGKNDRYISTIKEGILLASAYYEYFFIFDGHDLSPAPKIEYLAVDFKFNPKVFQDSKRQYWFYLGEGVELADSLTDTNTRDISSWFGDSKVNNIFEDREGNIWVSTNSNGAYVLYNSAFQQYHSRNNSLPNDYIYDIAGDSKSNVFIGTQGGGMTAMRGDSIIAVGSIGDSQAELYDVFVNADNEIFTSLGGLFQRWTFDGENFSNSPVFSDQLGSVKRIVEKSPKQTMLASGQFFIILTNTLTYQYPIASSYNISIYSTLLNDKIILLGTNRGIYHLTHFDITPDTINEHKIWGDLSQYLHPHRRHSGVKKEKWGEPYLHRTETFSAPLVREHQFEGGEVIDYYIADIQQDTKGGIWIATRKNGLYYIVDNVIQRHYTAGTQGLTSNICNRLFIDPQDNIWVATMQGISLIDATTQNIRKITGTDGLLANHVTSVYTRDSLVYVGTSEGLSLFHERDIRQNEQSPPILIESVRFNEMPHDMQDSSALSFRQNNLFIRYVGLSYSGNRTYTYRLKGLMTDWVVTDDNSIRFPALAPGNYTFEVKALNKDGLVSTAPAWYSFRLKPHPLQSRVAYAVYFLLLFGSIFGYSQWRVWNIRRKEAEKTAINKQFAELELQALQSQMNPHFVFNALGAIQSFILQKDDLTANRYLSDFGKLMRLFLESSKEKYITLDDEIQLLTLYIQLEKLRFEQRFDYTIEVDEQLDTELIEIPSMLLQPFIENAINHGVRYLKGKGYISVSFQQINAQKILCIVEDNGVGRQKAKEIREQTMRGHKSRGTKIIEERLNVLATLGHDRTSIQITFVNVVCRENS